MSERTDEILREMGYKIEPRKPKTPQLVIPDVAQGRDLFQTPNYATDLLIPFIPKHVKWIWECAAGEGKMSKRLMDFGYEVNPTDIIGGMKFNFVTEIRPEWYVTRLQESGAIITNPPYSLKRKFYEKCLEYKVPFALLIPADYSGWIIKAIDKDGAEKIIPTRRIDYITPTGLSGATGHTSYYHSMWLTWGFNLGKTETFVELTKQMKENI